MISTARHLAAAALLLLATSACGTPAPRDAPAKSGSGELRTDLEPLVKRFPLVADAEKAEWMSGTLGDPRAPGPSTYWIDAVVTLPPSAVAALTAGTRETDAVPEVAEGFRAHLPGGPFLTGGSLDQAFATQDWSVTAYLAENTGTIVLVALGQ